MYSTESGPTQLRVWFSNVLRSFDSRNNITLYVVSEVAKLAQIAYVERSIYNCSWNNHDTHFALWTQICFKEKIAEWLKNN